MNPDRLRVTLGPILPAVVLEVSDQFLLLRVDGDHRLACRQRLLHLSIDIAELGVPVGMAGAFRGLAIALQAEPALPENRAHQRMADRVALGLKRCREPAQALARPAQRRLRIAPRRRLDQRLQIRNQRGILGNRRLAPPAQAPNTPHQQILADRQLLQATADRTRRHTGRRRHRSNPAIPRRNRLRGRNQAPPTFVEERRDRFKPLPDSPYVNHEHKIWFSQTLGNPPSAQNPIRLISYEP